MMEGRSEKRAWNPLTSLQGALISSLPFLHQPRRELKDGQLQKIVSKERGYSWHLKYLILSVTVSFFTVFRCEPFYQLGALMWKGLRNLLRKTIITPSSTGKGRFITDQDKLFCEYHLSSFFSHLFLCNRLMDKAALMTQWTLHDLDNNGSLLSKTSLTAAGSSWYSSNSDLPRPHFKRTSPHDTSNK